MTEEIRKSAWTIRTVQRVAEFVTFPEPLTAEEAMDAYAVEEYDDILDTETVSVVDIVEAY